MERTFETLLAEISEETGGREVGAGGDNFLDVAGRRVQLRHVAHSKQLVISTQVYAPLEEDDELRLDLVGEFNAYHLLRGGYCLLVGEESKGLFVAQSLSVASLEANELLTILRDFAERAASCSNWYLMETQDRSKGERSLQEAGTIIP